MSTSNETKKEAPALNNEEEATESEREENLRISKEEERIAQISFRWRVIILYVILFLLVFLLLPYEIVVVGKKLNWGALMFVSILLYTITGVRKIESNELATREFFGKLLDNVPSGFAFVPPLLFKLHTNPRTHIQHEFPAPPEHIFRAPREDKTGIIPPGKYPPIYVTFGKKEVDKIGGEDASCVLERDPLDERITAEVTPVVIYVIKDHRKFLLTVHTVDLAKKQLEDACSSLLAEEFGKVTPQVVIADYGKYFKKLTDHLEKATRDWGIEIKSSKIKPIRFSHELSIAILSVPQAIADGKATVISSEGERQSKILIGNGMAKANRDMLDGETEAYATRAERLDIRGVHVVDAEVARSITEGGNSVIVGPQGVENLLSLVTSGKKALDSMNPEQRESSPEKASLKESAIIIPDGAKTDK